MGRRDFCALRAWFSAAGDDMWTMRMGVSVRVAREIARCVASDSAIWGRAVAW